jgi:aminoglycoside 3-N-acetyltransferase
MTIIHAEETFLAFTSALSQGDDVMIHSSLSRLGTFVPSIEMAIDLLLASVGSTGTLVMMSDTRSFAKTGRFDIRQPSETGLLTETFRKRSGVARSLVPMVSFVAQGARADEYLQPYHSHLDATAPLQRLLANDGKVLLMGVGYEKCTLFHLSEERHAIPGNFYKTFKGVMVDGDRVLAPITQRYYVRRDMAVKKDPSIAGRMLEMRGQVTEIPLGDGLVRVFRARDFDRCCMDVLSENPNAFNLAKTNKTGIA